MILSTFMPVADVIMLNNCSNCFLNEVINPYPANVDNMASSYQY